MDEVFVVPGNIGFASAAVKSSGEKGKEIMADTVFHICLKLPTYGSRLELAAELTVFSFLFKAQAAQLALPHIAIQSLLIRLDILKKSFHFLKKMNFLLMI